MVTRGNEGHPNCGVNRRAFDSTLARDFCVSVQKIQLGVTVDCVNSFPGT